LTPREEAVDAILRPSWNSFPDGLLGGRITVTILDVTERRSHGSFLDRVF